jgi:hypothetical protein
MPSADLIRLVETLGAPYGLERSVKITRGALADDRCLISLGRSAFGEAPADRLVEMGRTFHMPPRFADALPVALERADIVHFGYEAGRQHDVYKIYLEYASEARNAMATSRTPVLVHLAYKWVAQKPDSSTVTRYTWVPCRNRAEIEVKLQELIPFNEAANARRCVFGLLARIARFADTGELLLMEVEEPDNPRRSCDLNVYDAGVRMHDITDLIDATLNDFAVPSAQARMVFDRVGDRALGHLSAGVGRDGQEFVTLYFGVEAH